MKWWPTEPKQRLRTAVLFTLLLGVVGFAARRLTQRYGWGQGDITPTVSGPTPDDTPLPHAGEVPPVPAMRSEWRAMAVPKDRAARHALWLTPEHPAPGSTPLVIVLHGDGGSAKTFHEQFSYEEASGTWATLVYPDGIGNTWDTAGQEGNRDIAFLDALVDEAIVTRAVDPARVFLTGYSSGGFLAQLYACQRSAKVRGIATHEAGAPYNQSERWPNGSPKCPGQDKVAMMAAHGRDDFSVGFKSGVYSALYWAQVNGCNAHEAKTTGYPECYAYVGCAAGKPAVFCDIPGLGHWVWSEGAMASVRFFQGL